jgi:hypothetical protein
LSFPNLEGIFNYVPGLKDGYLEYKNLRETMKYSQISSELDNSSGK